MSKGKKSFIFYTNWYNTFKTLSKDKEKGYDLLMHILAYVNDENPSTDDMLINAVFQNIKDTLDRDLQKFKERKEKHSTSGALGNLKRYNLDLYDKVIKKEITLNHAIELAKARKATKGVAKLAVNDNVNDSVNVNDILLEKETKEDFLSENSNLDLKNEEERKKVAPKKEVLTSDMFDKVPFMGKLKIYLRDNFEYIFFNTPEEAIQIAMIRNIIERKIKLKFPDKIVTDKEIFESFKFVIENMDDWVRQKQFTLKYFSNNFEVIYNQAKANVNGISKNNESDNRIQANLRNAEIVLAERRERRRKESLENGDE